MTTLDIIQSLCFKYQYLRQQLQQDRDLRRGQLIVALKNQIARLKREYRDERERRQARVMLYQYNDRFFLADKEITMYEYNEYRRLRALKVA